MTINHINIALIIALVILSFLTIIWHDQNRLLYRKTKSVQKNNQTILAKQRQLLSEYSEQMSGNKVQTKAIKILHMQRPVKVRILSL